MKNEKCLAYSFDLGKGYTIKCPIDFGFDIFTDDNNIIRNISKFFCDEYMNYFDYYENLKKMTIKEYFDTTQNFFYKEIESELLIEDKRKIESLSFYGLKCLHFLDILPKYDVIITGNEGMSPFSCERYLNFLKIIQEKKNDKTIIYLLMSTLNNEYKNIEIDDLI